VRDQRVIPFLSLGCSLRAAVAAALFVACGSYGAEEAPSPGTDLPPDAGADAEKESSSDASPVMEATLTVKLAGTGKGLVTSADFSIDCGSTCTHTFARGEQVELTASALADSVFTGWGVPCGGTKCAVNVIADMEVVANFAATVLDVDGNRGYESANDAKLISRYLFGFTGTALTDAAIGTNATRSSPEDVLAYLQSIRSLLDVDADGKLDPLTDAVLITRYLDGLRGSALTDGAVGAGAMRGAVQIEAYLKSLTP
jgi:hypothetical protein